MRYIVGVLDLLRYSLLVFVCDLPALLTITYMHIVYTICSLGSVRSHALPSPISIALARSLALSLCLSHTLCLSSDHFHSLFACLARSNWRVNWQLVQLSSLSLIRAFAFAFAFNIIILYISVISLVSFRFASFATCNMQHGNTGKHLHRVNETQTVRQ